MSSRQLKKLRAQEELARQAALRSGESAAGSGGDGAGSDSDNDDDDAVVATRPRAKNPFAAFAALGDDGDGGADEDEDEDDQQKNDSNSAHDDGRPRDEPSPDEPAGPRLSKKPKKKKKNKAKGGGKLPAKADAAATADEATASAAAAETRTAELDEIDRALNELDLKAAAAQPPSASGVAGAASSAAAAATVKVNMHDLRVMNELREVFGRDIVNAAQADDAAGVPGRRMAGGEGNARVVEVDLETYLRADPPPPRGMVRINQGGAAAGMAGLVAKRNPFIQWKDTWPRATSGGLSMRQVTPDDKGSKGAQGAVEFTFVHSPAYVQLEDTFYTLSLMMNPQAMIQFLKQHPFHISSLILVSIIAKVQDGNASLAADLCERALFSFGRSTLSSFRTKLADGRARLSFRRPENRQFVLVGYHYIRSLILRGTYRTALAWVKLFLSLMPDDEYALVLFAQTLAVKAFDAKWFIGYCGSDDQDPPALRSNPMRDYVRQSLIPARLQVKDVEGARAALAQGMARLPWLYGALCQALGLDVPRTVWGIQPRDEAEVLYTQLYIHLAKDIWDVPQAAALLKEAGVAAAVPGARVAKPDIALLPPAEPVTLALARFVYLDSTPALLALVVPKTLLHAQPSSDFDPLPPPRDENTFSNPSQLRPWIMAQNEQNGQGGGNYHAAAAHMAALEDGFLMQERGDDGDDGFDDEAYSDDAFSVEAGEDVEELQAESRPAPRPQESQQSSNPPTGMPGAWFEDDE